MSRLPTLALCLFAMVVLAACSLPPQPDIAVASSASASAAAPSSARPASPSAAGRVATVTGTGRFGLSIRSGPGLSAARIATVPDGFQATVVGGPVGQDGSDWYQLQGQGVAGWASATYLTLSSASAAASVPPPAASPSASGVALPTPLGGLLSQLNRDSNYDVNGSGIFVEAPLKAAVDHLSASPTAEALLRRTAPVYLRITVGHFDMASEGGQFSTLGHSIQIGDNIMTESLDVQSTITSHELQHASDILVDHMAPETAQDCINLELRAFQTEEKVWLELTKPSPPQTKMESELDGLSHVVNTPAFAKQLTQLYASECSPYGSPSPSAAAH